MAEKRRIYAKAYLKALKGVHPMGGDDSVWPSFKKEGCAGMTTTVIYPPGSEEAEAAIAESTLEGLQQLLEVV